jgi:hypothetical protein
LSWKFFKDRAPYWAGGFAQIIKFKHLFPIPNMPDIATKIERRVELTITFGSHTTFVELIRKYGIIAGGVLSFCLIYIVIASRRVFHIMHLDPIFVPFFSMAFACTIILSLTGQFQILPGYALLSLGTLGIAYSIYYQLLETKR